MSDLPPLLLFDNFDLRFEQSVSQDTYRVRIESSAGQAKGPLFRLPPNIHELALCLQTDDTLVAQVLGRMLYDLVFQDEVLVAYIQSKAIAESKGKSLRLRFRFQDMHELASLPWELITADAHLPLSVSPRSPVVRFLDHLDTPKPLVVSLPLRILVVIAAPASLPLIDSDSEWEALSTALLPLQNEGRVVLECLPRATFLKLQHLLNRGTPYHIFHYIGHSRYNSETRQGELLLESDEVDEQEKALPAEGLAGLLADYKTTHSETPRSLRLAYLNSCQGATASVDNNPTGIVHALVDKGLPAVIAMQGYIPSRAAIKLSALFYGYLAQGNPVDVALSLARQTFRHADGATAWALPTLFLRSDNSYLFALPGQVLPGTENAVLPPAPGTPPYQGLVYYDVHDHARFFGRESLTTKLVQHLGTHPLLLVVGASGSGKSSLVRAGVIPVLLGMRQEVSTPSLPRAPSTWQLRLLTPTAHPLAALAATLTRHDPSVLAAKQLQSDIETDLTALDLYVRRHTAGQPEVRILLVIDQFEELFTLCKQPVEQERFIATLFHVLEQEGPLSLILTLRADFYHKCNPYPVLRSALEQHQHYIGPMSPDELRRTIVLPAQQGNWDFELGLEDLLLEDAGSEPGNLPLLSHALRETWERRSGRTLTYEGYVASGRIQGAIARTADTTVANLNESDQGLVRKLFVEMTELGEGTQDTRRRVLTDSLLTLAKDSDQVTRLLKTLADARLITLDEGTAEVAHEALIREWEALRQWVDENRAWVRFQRELARDVEEWDQLGRDVGSLYAGIRLARALAEAKGHEVELRSAEREFLEESQRRENEELVAKQKSEAQRKRNVMLTILASVAIVMAIIAVGFFVFAMLAKGEAEAAQTQEKQAKEQALSQRLTAESSLNLLVEHRSDLALLTAIEAIKQTDQNEPIPPEALEQLYATLAATGGIPLTGSNSPISMSVISPNSRWLAAGNKEGEVRIWDLLNPTLPPRLLSGHSERISALSFSQDSMWLVTGEDNGENVNLWNLEDMLPMQAEPYKSFPGHFEGVTTLTFSRDNKWLVVGSNDWRVRLWDWQTLDDLPAHILPADYFLRTLVISNDNHWIITVTNDGSVDLWDLEALATNQEPVHTPLEDVAYTPEFALSPDGTWFAVGSYSGVLLWNLDTLALRQDAITLPHNRNTVIEEVAFSPSNYWLVTVDRNEVLRRWNLQQIQNQPNPISPFEILSVGTAEVTSLAFSADDLAVASTDSLVRLWDHQRLTKPPRILISDAPINKITYSADGRWLATSSDANFIVRLWELPIRYEEPRILRAPSESAINAMDISQTGDCLVTGGGDLIPRLWDLQNLEAPLVLEAPSVSLNGHQNPIRNVAFSPDGSWLATGSDDAVIKLWRLQGCAITSDVPLQYQGSAFAFSPASDAKWFLYGSWGTDSKLLDLSNIILPAHTLSKSTGTPDAFAFSPDGDTVVIANSIAGGNTLMWNLQNFTSTPIPFSESIPSIDKIAFSSDGKYLFAYDEYHNTFELRNAQGAPNSGCPPRQPKGKLTTFAFSPDNKWLAVAGSVNVSLWNLLDCSQDPIILSQSVSNITALAFSGEFLAVGTYDGTVQYWKIDSLNQMPVALRSHTTTVNDLGFTTGYDWLITTSSDTTALIWTLDPEELIDKACAVVGRPMTAEEWERYLPGEDMFEDRSCNRNRKRVAISLILTNKEHSE